MKITGVQINKWRRGKSHEVRMFLEVTPDDLFTIVANFVELFWPDLREGDTTLPSFQLAWNKPGYRMSVTTNAGATRVLSLVVMPFDTINSEVSMSFESDDWGFVAALVEYLRKTIRQPDAHSIALMIKKLRPSQRTTQAALEWYHKEKRVGRHATLKLAGERHGYTEGTLQQAHQGCEEDVCRRKKTKQN